jgi:hypothetical protein
MYTHADVWQAAGGGSGEQRGASPACVHWTGEKPWAFQKRRDLQDLVGE